VSSLLILDNEAVQALMSTEHPKHRRALSFVQVVARRKKKSADVAMVVPTAVRVEAGWDRTAESAAFINLLRIRDGVLDGASANAAAAIVSAHGVSVADAHIGVVIRSRLDPSGVTVLSSDPEDMRVVAGAATVTVVRL
jgi:predicted nucleic acid-binding protein